MKIKKGLIFKILAIAVVLAVSGFVLTSFAKAQIPKKPVENVYIFDYADLIDSSDEEQMRALAKEIEDKSKAEIVVVTVDSLGSYTIEEYANELFNSWGIGDKELNNGVLILVNKENLLSGKKGRIRIEVGYGLEGAITDGKAGRILDEYAIPAFEKKEYSKGIKDTFLAVASEVAKEYGLKIEGLLGYEAAGNDSTESVNVQGDDIKLLNFFIIFVVIFLVILFIIIVAAGGGEQQKNYKWTYPTWQKNFDNDNDDDDNHFHFGRFGGFGSGGSSGGGFGGGSSGGGGASR